MGKGIVAVMFSNQTTVLLPGTDPALDPRIKAA